LRVSTADQIEVSRSNAGTGLGRLELGEGSLVSAPGSITLDVGGSALTRGSFDIGSGSVGLGASRIALGAAPEAFEGIVVNSSVLGSVRNGTLDLLARDGLDVFAGTDLTARRVSITAPRSLQWGRHFGQHRRGLVKLTGAETVPLALAGVSRLAISANPFELV
jgi:hypothetical protein